MGRAWLLRWANSFFLGKEEPGCCEMLGAEVDTGGAVSVQGVRMGPGVPCSLRSSPECWCWGREEGRIWP